MNKIPINVLLNPEEHENLKTQLQNINTKLTLCCTKLTEGENNLNEDDHEELKQILSYLTGVVKNEKLNQDEVMLVRTTYQLSTTLLYMVREKKSNDNSKISSSDNNSSSEESCSNSSTDETERSKILFNVITQEMMNKNKKSYRSYRGHRLAKQNVLLMEKWYLENMDQPYLDEASITSLMRATSLTKVQIKNWVSNKRRKEKAASISPEISQILKETETNV